MVEKRDFLTPLFRLTGAQKAGKRIGPKQAGLLLIERHHFSLQQSED
jgi:hypothetical protein